jgi:hypothetical protein
MTSDYQQQTWRNDDRTTPVSAERLSHIEEGLVDHTHPAADTRVSAGFGSMSATPPGDVEEALALLAARLDAAELTEPPRASIQLFTDFAGPISLQNNVGTLLDPMLDGEGRWDEPENPDVFRKLGAYLVLQQPGWYWVKTSIAVEVQTATVGTVLRVVDVASEPGSAIQAPAGDFFQQAMAIADIASGDGYMTTETFPVWVSGRVGLRLNASMVGANGTARVVYCEIDARGPFKVQPAASPLVDQPTMTAGPVFAPAAAQATTIGKGLTLGKLGARVYIGYGDWNANTGPITIGSIDRDDVAVTTELAGFMTEAVDEFVEFDSKLWTPAIDPRGSPEAEYAVRSAAGVWSQSQRHATQPVFAGVIHVLAMAAFGGRLFAAGAASGSVQDDAVIWVTADSGVTWTESLRVPSTVSGKYKRFYWIGELNGKLYAEYWDSDTFEHGPVKVFDGVSWSDGPDVWPADWSWVSGKKARRFGNELLLLTFGNLKHIETMLAWNGTSARFPLELPGYQNTYRYSVWDYDIEAGVLYVLAADMWQRTVVLSSPDAVEFTEIRTAPSDACSIAVADGTIFVGTFAGQVWRAPL